MIRSMIATLLGVVLACPNAAAQVSPALPDLRIATPASLTQESYRLWQGAAPGARGDAEADIPTLTAFRPQPDRANGTAVVIAPGGGYIALASTLEGIEPASWFTARGVTAFVLRYRVADAARLPVVLADGARAVRFVRAHAKALKLDPHRIGMMGFSAGGHLAASTALGMRPTPATTSDPVDKENSQPDFLVLAYPWLEATKIKADGDSDYCAFARTLKIPCAPREYEKFNPVDFVTPNAPPTFIYHTSDDTVVPVEGSIALYLALRKAKVDVELHAYRKGPHGTGLGGSDPALNNWPELLDNWLRAHGWIGNGFAASR